MASASAKKFAEPEKLFIAFMSPSLPVIQPTRTPGSLVALSSPIIESSRMNCPLLSASSSWPLRRPSAEPNAAPNELSGMPSPE